MITGAGGFVGSNLARRMLNDGCEVHLFLRDGTRRWRLQDISEDVSHVEIDLRDRDAVELAIGSIRPDWVFHLAAYGAYPQESDLPRMVETNITGTINLLEACVQGGVEAFINTGSSSEYGYKDHGPRETEVLEPNSHYSWTKASATHYCRYTATTCDVHIPTLRLYSVFGPYEQPGRLMPALVVRGLRGELPPLVNPSISRDFVYIDDVCDAYLLAAATGSSEPGPVYNVGSGTQTTLSDVVEVARTRLRIAEQPKWGAMHARNWDTEVWVSDNRKILSELGWTARRTLAQGFDQFVLWFVEHPEVHQQYS